MVFRKTGSVKDFEYRPMKGIEAEGKEILEVKPVQGFFAAGNTCTHRGCNLSSGRLGGETVRCPFPWIGVQCQDGRSGERPGKEPGAGLPGQGRKW
jgi:nitrite reductase/ring-hydroxylating ferredoxin subunit